MIALKLLCAAVLLAVWGGLAYAGKTEMAPFITFVQTSLISLAAHSLFTNAPQPKEKQDETS